MSANRKKIQSVKTPVREYSDLIAKLDEFDNSKMNQRLIDQTEIVLSTFNTSKEGANSHTEKLLDHLITLKNALIFSKKNCAEVGSTIKKIKKLSKGVTEKDSNKLNLATKIKKQNFKISAQIIEVYMCLANLFYKQSTLTYNLDEKKSLAQKALDYSDTASQRYAELIQDLSSEQLFYKEIKKKLTNVMKSKQMIENYHYALNQEKGNQILIDEKKLENHYNLFSNSSDSKFLMLVSKYKDIEAIHLNSYQELVEIEYPEHLRNLVKLETVCRESLKLLNELELFRDEQKFLKLISDSVKKTLQNLIDQFQYFTNHFSKQKKFLEAIQCSNKAIHLLKFYENTFSDSLETKIKIKEIRHTWQTVRGELEDQRVNELYNLISTEPKDSKGWNKEFVSESSSSNSKRNRSCDFNSMQFRLFLPITLKDYPESNTKDNLDVDNRNRNDITK